MWLGLQATIMEGVQGYHGCPRSTIVGIQGHHGCPGSSWVFSIHYGGCLGSSRVSRVITESKVHHGGCPGSSWVSWVITGVQGPPGRCSGSSQESEVITVGVQGQSQGVPSLQSPHPFWWPCFPRCPRQHALPGLWKALSWKLVSVQAQSRFPCNKRTLITFHSLLLFEHLLFLIDISGAIRIW